MVDAQFVLCGIFGEKPLAVGAVDEAAVGELAPVGDGDHAGGVAADAEHGVVAESGAGAFVFGADGEDADAVVGAQRSEVPVVEGRLFDLKMEAEVFVLRILLDEFVHRDDGGEGVGAAVTGSGLALDIEQLAVDLFEFEAFVGLGVCMVDGLVEEAELGIPDVEVE